MAIEPIGKFLRIPKPKPSNFSTQHQHDGGEVAKKLGAKTSSEYARVVHEFKVAPQRAQRAWSFVADANARKPLGLFFWKINQLKKDEKGKNPQKRLL